MRCGGGEQELPLRIPDGYRIVMMAPAAEKLDSSKKESDALLDLCSTSSSSCASRASYGRCKGTIVSKVNDRRRVIAGDSVNFLAEFDVDKGRMQGGELHLTNKVESFKEELYAGAARSQIVSEEVTHRELRIKVHHFSSWRELPDVCFESLGGREAAKGHHKRHKAARKAALAAAGLLPTDASQQGSVASSEAPSDAGAKRAAPGENGDAPAGKVAKGNVPLQREQSMGDGELIDGVAGKQGDGAFQLNLQ